MNDPFDRKNIEDYFQDKSVTFEEALKQSDSNVDFVVNSDVSYFSKDFLEKISEEPPSDNDTMILTLISMGKMLKRNCELYHCDDWELLYENMFCQKYQEDYEIKLKDISELYTSEKQLDTSIKRAKNILSKTPPEKFTKKWPILKSKTFRERMSKNGVNALITVYIAMKFAKNAPVEHVFETYDLELLSQQLIMNRTQ